MVLHIIGLGLYSEKDISLRGLETAKKCDEVYLEDYTSRLMGTTPERISTLIGKKVITLDRDDIERGKIFLKAAKTKEVALLVGGDPSVATTHSEIVLEARKDKIDVKIVHSSSIMGSVCESGLFAYNFGRSCSIPFWQNNFRPTSFYDIIEQNHTMGAHTLVFLDLRPSENRFMTIKEALSMILEASGEKRGSVNKDTIAVGLARIGSEDRVIKAGRIGELMNQDFGGPMHIIIIPGKMHFVEKEMLNLN